MTAQPLFDGTFSTAAVASAAHALVQQLHDEAMATIATLADTWDAPVEDTRVDTRLAGDGEPVTYRDPATWSVEPDDEYEDEEEVRRLPRTELPPLLLRPRTATRALAGAATDEFAVPARGNRQFAAL